jgi:hypothetical protein
LVGLGFSIDDAALSKFNKAIQSASVKVAALYASIQTAATGIFYGISKISEGFEQIGYEMRLVAPAINKFLILREAMLHAYKVTGVDLTKVVQQSILFNLSLAKTKFALEAVYKSVAARFFPLLTKQMDIFRNKIFANMPKIQDALEKFVKFIFKAFDITVQFGSRVWSILGRIYDMFKSLDEATSGWSTIILGIVAAWKLLNLSFLATPLGMILTGLTAIIALYDDFKVWQEGGESLIDWGSRTTKMIVGIISAIGILAGVIGGILAAYRSWIAVQWLLNAAMTANPIGMIIAGVTALIALLTTLAVKMGYLKGVGDFFSGLGEKTINLLGGSGSAPNLGAATQPAPLMPGNTNSSQRISQETNINIMGSADASAVGKSVASQQDRVNFDMTRNLKGAIR